MVEYARVSAYWHRGPQSSVPGSLRCKQNQVIIFSITVEIIFECQKSRVADPQQFNADPDPTFHLNADPDPLQGDRNLRPLSILSLRASIVTAHSPRINLEPLKLLNFDFNADPDPASKKTGPDPQPCLLACLLAWSVESSSPCRRVEDSSV